MELVETYPRIDIIHFFGEERYAKAQKLNETCNELMRQSYNEMVAAIIGKYGNRDVQRSELNAFFDDALNGLLTKDLINTLVGALYPLVADALGSNASVAGALDINVLPKTLAKNIKHYPAVKAALESAGDDWNAVDWELCDWVTTRGVAVTDLDTFIDAFGESLSGLTKVLNVLLNGTTLNAIVITLYGNQGYEKDILPLLEARGAIDKTVESIEMLSWATGSTSENCLVTYENGTANPSNPNNKYTFAGEIEKNENKTTPYDFEVDYVRVYQFN